MPHCNGLTKLNILVVGVYIVSNTALTDISNHVRQFYSRFNNVLFVIGKGSREMCTLPLNKVYCLPSLPYGYETGFWRESVKPLQYFCQSLPISYFIDQRKLLFWRKLAMHNNVVIFSFFCVDFCCTFC